jgi:peptidoglycan hydrolase CwlO-like protein
MSLKRKQTLLRQKAYFEQRLNDRLALLAGKGIEGKMADKDALLRNLKADVKAVKNRLKAIADSDKITEDMAKARAAKAAAPAQVKEAVKAGKAEKPKKGSEQPKEKKPKPEKKPAPPADAAK